MDAELWGWQAAFLGTLPIMGFSLILILAPHAALGWFLADPGTIALAEAPLSVVALGMSVDAFGRILGFALRGAGATRAVTAIAFLLQWGVQLPLGWFVGVYLGFGLPGLAVNRLIWFAVEAGLCVALWRNGFWKQT